MTTTTSDDGPEELPRAIVVVRRAPLKDFDGPSMKEANNTNTTANTNTTNTNTATALFSDLSLNAPVAGTPLTNPSYFSSFNSIENSTNMMHALSKMPDHLSGGGLSMATMSSDASDLSGLSTSSVADRESQRDTQRERAPANQQPASTSSSLLPSGAHSHEPVAAPTLISWNMGGQEVYVTGTFNDWKEKVPMAKR